MHIFDILGPIMVGPSSSHTAGAVRIGYAAYKLLQELPAEAKICLYGSFADTGGGHGTDRAIVAGLLGMKQDDMRIPDSFRIAADAGLVFSFEVGQDESVHPNTVCLSLKGSGENMLELQAASIGGGGVRIQKLDGIELSFSLEKPTLIVHNLDRPGCVAEVAALLSDRHVNIASMQLYRNRRAGRAVMVLETDQAVSENALDRLRRFAGILKVTCFYSGEV